MFRQLAFQMQPNATPAQKESVANDLLSRHPFEIATALERAWNNRPVLAPPSNALGSPDNRSILDGLALSLTTSSGAPTAIASVVASVVRWDHLIYAFMIENTRVYEIFRRVLHELVKKADIVIDTASRNGIRTGSGKTGNASRASR